MFLQVQLLFDLAQSALTAARRFSACSALYRDTTAAPRPRAAPPPGAPLRATPLTSETPRPPPTGSSSPPDPVPDPVITITETSDSLSEAVDSAAAADLHSNAVKLSLWLQWTLPKCVLSVYSVDEANTGLCCWKLT